MSLLHSRPVAAQRVYYKPSTMSRLKAMFAPRRTAARPVHRTAVRKQPVVRTTHRRRRPVAVAPRARRVGPLDRLAASLRPRRRAAPVRVAPTHGHHPRRTHHRGTFASLIAILTMKNRRHHRRY